MAYNLGRKSTPMGISYSSIRLTSLTLPRFDHKIATICHQGYSESKKPKILVIIWHSVFPKHWNSSLLVDKYFICRPKLRIIQSTKMLRQLHSQEKLYFRLRKKMGFTIARCTCERQMIICWQRNGREGKYRLQQKFSNKIGSNLNT